MAFTSALGEIYMEKMEKKERAVGLAVRFDFFCMISHQLLVLFVSFCLFGFLFSVRIGSGVRKSRDLRPGREN